MATLGTIGIIVALALFMFLIYKGWSVYWVALICVLIVALTNQMDLIPTFTNTYIIGIFNTAKGIFVIVFFGALMGKVFTDTGAAASIAMTITKRFVIKRSGPARIKMAILCLLVFGGLLTLGGIDCYAQLFTMLPICLVIAEMVGIPRRFIPGMMVLNVPFITAPGAPQIYNIMTVQTVKQHFKLDLPVSFGAIPGWIGVIVIALVCYLVMSRMIIKAVENGESFTVGDRDPRYDKERKLPNFWVSLLPLVAVFVLYTILELDVTIALASGLILNILLMYNYIPDETMSLDGIKKGVKKLTKRAFPGRESKLIKSLNDGTAIFPTALIQLCVPAGLASVITATAVSGMLFDTLAGLTINPIWIAILAVAVITAITNSPIVAIMVAVPVAVGAALDAGTVSPALVARVMTVGTSTFESLPANGMVIMVLSLVGCTHKEGYKPVFLTTVIATLIGTFVVAGVCLAFPGLA